MKISQSLFSLFILLFVTCLKAQIPSNVPTNGLMGYWPFSGNANDLGANGYNGTVSGASLTSDRFSNANSAYSFNGTNNYIVANYQGIMGTNSRAVSFWAKTTASTTWMTGVAWGNNNTATRFNCMFNYNGSGPTIDGSFGAITYSAGVNIYDNNWHHFVYQFNNSVLNQVEIYVDGSVLTQTLHAYNPTNILSTTIGFNVHFGRIVYSGGDLFFNGSLDDIGIWNRKLTTCEIQGLYNSSAIPSVTLSTSNSTICVGQSATLTANGATTYSWNTSSTNSSIVVSPTTTTSYSVIGTNSITGCSKTETISLVVELCTGVEKNSISDVVEVFPNPVGDYFTVSGIKRGSTISLYNITGILVYSGTVQNELERININYLPYSVYLLKVESEKGIIIKKIIKD